MSTALTVKGLHGTLSIPVSSTLFGNGFPQIFNPKAFGALADGTLHTVAEWIIPSVLGKYTSFEELHIDYPFVLSLDESIDLVATQALINYIKGMQPTDSYIEITGRHVWNRELIVDTPITIHMRNNAITIEQLNWTDVTPTSGNYIKMVGDGAVCRTIKTRRKYRGSPSAEHDAPLSAAINIQADGVTLRNVLVFMEVDPSKVTAVSSYDLRPAVLATLDGNGVGIAPNYYGAPAVYTPKAWADVEGVTTKNWDVGIFVGTRLKTTLEHCATAFFENSGVYVDITNSTAFPFNNWRGVVNPPNSVAGSDGFTMTKCYTFGSNYGARILGALPKEGLSSYGRDYKNCIQLSLMANPIIGDYVTIGGYQYDKVTNTIAVGATYQGIKFVFTDDENTVVNANEVPVLIGVTKESSALNLFRTISDLFDEDAEEDEVYVDSSSLFSYANYHIDYGSNILMMFPKGYALFSIERFNNCFEVQYVNNSVFQATVGNSSLVSGVYKVKAAIGSDPAPYYWGSGVNDFVEDRRGSYGCSDTYLTECQFFALKRPNINGFPVVTKQMRLDRNWEIDLDGGAAIEVDGLSGNSSRCIQKHFYSRNRVDGQGNLHHIRLGRVNSITLMQCHPDGNRSTPKYLTQNVINYGWLVRTKYTKSTANIAHGVPRPNPDICRIYDGWYQAIGTTRFGNGGLESNGVIVGTRLRIEASPAFSGEGVGEIIAGNESNARLVLKKKNSSGYTGIKYFGGSNNSYLLSTVGNYYYEVPSASFQRWQFRTPENTITEEMRLNSSGLSVRQSIRVGGIGVGGATIQSGTGSPEGVVTANKGAVYLRTDGGTGTTLYYKESGTGSTGWVSQTRNYEDLTNKPTVISIQQLTKAQYDALTTGQKNDPAILYVIVG